MSKKWDNRVYGGENGWGKEGREDEFEKLGKKPQEKCVWVEVREILREFWVQKIGETSK